MEQAFTKFNKEMEHHLNLNSPQSYGYIVSNLDYVVVHVKSKQTIDISTNLDVTHMELNIYGLD